MDYLAPNSTKQRGAGGLIATKKSLKERLVRKKYVFEQHVNINISLSVVVILHLLLILLAMKFIVILLKIR